MHALAVEVRQGTLADDGQLRSGREHWSPMVAVEVRQGTLARSRLRSGAEHWSPMVAVEVCFVWWVSVKVPRGRGAVPRQPLCIGAFDSIDGNFRALLICWPFEQP